MAALSTILIASSTALAAGSSIAQGGAQRRAADEVQRNANRMANDAVARGEEDVGLFRLDLAQRLGAQRARAGAEGIDINSGSAAQLRDEAERYGEADVERIRENTRREAFAIRSGGSSQANSLRQQATGSYLDAGSTLLTGGIDTYRSWQAGRSLRVPTMGALSPLPARSSSTVANPFQPARP